MENGTTIADALECADTSIRRLGNDLGEATRDDETRSALRDLHTAVTLLARKVEALAAGGTPAGRPTP